MRIVLALSLAVGAFLMTQGAATAAPLALSDHAAATKTLGENAGVERVGWRGKTRRCARRYARQYCCVWQCTPYWRPYQYYYWQHYYPYGGPLF
jgi:hypothetical protein